jgi:hypothetical protein
MMLRDVDVNLETALAQYAQHGYARLGRVLSDDGIAALTARAEDLMLGRVVYPGMFFQMDAPNGRYEDAPLGLGWQGPSLAYRKLEKLELDPRFREWIFNPLFESVARARIEGPVVLYRCILFNKGPGGGSEIPWHQDGGKLWGLSADPQLQIWTALDDAPADGGCLEVVPGTHTHGMASPLGGVVPKEKLGDAAARAVALTAVAGEAILLHNALWHRSLRSRTGRRRLGLSVCFMSAATKCMRTKKKPRVFFPAFP